MAFQIDPSIPLQAQRTTFDPASILMQAQQNAANLDKHRFEMQKLREDYDLAKEQRKQQKQMQMGIASDLAGIQSGSPAQYAPTRFEQTPQRGQMPQGMTGVMMREQGQQIPQPQAFGEEILQGNFRLGGGEVTQEAVAGRQPTYPEMLAIGLKQAMLTKNQDEIFKYAKAIQDTEKQAVKFGMNPTKGINPQTMQPDYFVVNELGQKQFLGVNPYETPKDAKARVTWPVGRGRTEETWGYDAKGNEVLLGVKSLDAPQAPVAAKADPVEAAISVFQQKEDIKAKNETIKKYREKFANALDAIPLLNNYIAAAQQAPDTGWDSYKQTKLGYFGMGDKKQQEGMALEKQAGESLLTFAIKQPGPSTDKDVESYRAQMGVIADPNASTSQKVAAAQQAKIYVQRIHDKYGAYLGDILSGKVNPEDIAAKEVSNDPYRITKDTDPRRAKYLTNHKALVDAGDYEGAKMLTEIYKRGAK